MIFDGAYGTYIESLGYDVDFPEQLQKTDIGALIAIHREYAAAGAGALKTNTFSLNRSFIADKNERTGLISLALEAAGKAASEYNCDVFCDIGPISADENGELYIETAEEFLSSGGSKFLFETQNSSAGVCAAVRYLKKRGAYEIAVSFAVGRDGYSRSGAYYFDLIEAAHSAGADIVGLNCICGPAHMKELIERLPRGRYRLLAMPNAGYPGAKGDRMYYNDNPAYFAAKLREITALGVYAVGGCCGTTPRHIARISDAADAHITGGIRVVAAGTSDSHEYSGIVSDVKVAVEIAPPDRADPTYMLNAARELREAGADTITIPDSPLARARANSVICAAKIKRECGVNVLPHICCRDKNQIAIKGELIAASMEGVRDILAITGDAIPEEERTRAKNVYGFNSVRLISYIKSMNETYFSEAPFRIYAALNINVPNFDAELERAKRKAEAGAEIFMTQPVFSQSAAENIARASEIFGSKALYAGIMPLGGYKNAVFLNNEFPGIEIPDAIVESLRNAEDGERQSICVGWAIDAYNSVKSCCGGYYVMTPLKKTAYSIAVTEYIKAANSSHLH